MVDSRPEQLTLDYRAFADFSPIRKRIVPRDGQPKVIHLDEKRPIYQAALERPPREREGSLNENCGGAASLLGSPLTADRVFPVNRKASRWVASHEVAVAEQLADAWLRDDQKEFCGACSEDYK